MNGVIGMTELALGYRTDRRAAGLYLNTVKWSARRACSRLINDILDFSKIDAGRIELAPSIAAIPPATTISRRHAEIHWPCAPAARGWSWHTTSRRMSPTPSSPTSIACGR